MTKILKSMMLLVFALFLFAQDWHAITTLEKKWVKTITNPKVDTTPPTWFKPSKSEDVDYWLSVLPVKDDAKKHTQFVVSPALGMIAPIVETPAWSKDYKWLMAWKNVDLNKYFQQGAHLYPGTTPIWWVWNSVIGWHSNYYLSKRTPYTTVFGKIPMLDPKDEVWFYVKAIWAKAKPNEWILLKYKVYSSYETKPTDTKVMNTRKWKRDITLYTCTPIWTARNRWIIKWELSDAKSVILDGKIE
jgi:hypothetical protein